jgi:hypothetical protein
MIKKSNNSTKIIKHSLNNYKYKEKNAKLSLKNITVSKVCSIKIDLLESPLKNRNHLIYSIKIIYQILLLINLIASKILNKDAINP